MQSSLNVRKSPLGVTWRLTHSVVVGWIIPRCFALAWTKGVEVGPDHIILDQHIHCPQRLVLASKRETYLARSH
jgi:hypothetical protein